MGPSEAEVVRTLVRGRLPGRLHVAGGREVAQVCYATGCGGRPMMLARDGAELADVLRGWDHGSAPRVELAVDDVPPVAGAPGLGRARIVGWLRRLDADAASAAISEFAESNPVADLFDVGRDVSMHVLDVDRVLIDRHDVVRQIDVAGYAAAEPDPLHEVERDLLVDLADHHAAQIECFFHHVLTSAGVTCRVAPRAVRLDRYGFVVDLGAPEDGEPDHRWARLEFVRPVRDQHDLAHLLHPVLFHHHHRPSTRPRPCVADPLGGLA